LEQSWRTVLAASETVDAAVKAYLQQQEMVQVECRVGELVCTCEQEFVADKLIEKHVHISEIFSQALGGEVRITVRGGSNQKSVSLFEAFSPSFVPPAADFGVGQGVSDDKPTPKSGESLLPNGTPSDNAALGGAASGSTPQKTELPELDQAIVELFSAVAVPIR
jgi:hypothetical protein